MKRDELKKITRKIFSNEGEVEKYRLLASDYLSKRYPNAKEYVSEYVNDKNKIHFIIKKYVLNDFDSLAGSFKNYVREIEIDGYWHLLKSGVNEEELDKQLTFR